jgi:hypothetical protein
VLAPRTRPVRFGPLQRRNNLLAPLDRKGFHQTPSLVGTYRVILPSNYPVSASHEQGSLRSAAKKPCGLNR